MPQPYSEMEESRSVTPWVNRLYFESPRASSFLGLRLVKARHKNLVPLLSGVKPDPMVGSGRYAEPIPIKCPIARPSNGNSGPKWAFVAVDLQTSMAIGYIRVRIKLCKWIAYKTCTQFCWVLFVYIKCPIAQLQWHLPNMNANQPIKQISNAPNGQINAPRTCWSHCITNGGLIGVRS